MATVTTVSANLETLGNNNPSGCISLGTHRQVISEGVATRTLTAKESGSLCLFDRAAGVVYTLPTPVVGMYFDFMATVSVTSNAFKTITSAATEFLVGGIGILSLTVAEAGDFFAANGTTHVAISEDGATKGGLVGGSYRLVAISTTKWAIKGISVGAGTLADPFATS
jgi:hypothetical protein